MAHNWLIGAALLLGLVFLLFRERRSARSPVWMLLRCVFPSWRFFEEIEPGPELGYRVAARGEEFGPWRRALVAPPRALGSLVVNARGNLHLCYQSLVERLCDDIDEARATTPEELEELVSYQLVQRLVRGLVTERDANAESGEARERVYQFRLKSDEGGASGDAEFVSKPHAL
jgi:hypothetical protein